MKHLKDILSESLLDVNNDTDLDEKVIVSQFYDSIESQQYVIEYLHELIKKHSKLETTFTSIKNARWTDSIYVIFPKKQTPKGDHITFLKHDKLYGIRLWRAYGDTILDKVLVSIGEASYIFGPKSNYIYKVPEFMIDLVNSIINK
jgi:hypothetical protein